MKKLAIILSITLLFNPLLKATDTKHETDEPVIYTVFFNSVPDGFNAPLIGFINIAKGDHNNLQLGFLNTNYRNLSGAQGGFINTVGANTMGLQAGFINTTGANLNGLQYGFLNTTGGNVQGLQTGFLNTIGGDTKGVQAGFVNTTVGEMKGVQLGFINSVAKENTGVQGGFINTSAQGIEGGQFGFLNISRKLSGIQLGFINVLDTLEGGLPIGFLSFVRHNGFQAIEVGANEMYPFNFSFKTGVKHFYTSLIASYNPNMEKGFATGVGIGSIISLSDDFYFNPEISTVNSIGGVSIDVKADDGSFEVNAGNSDSNHFHKTTSLSPAFGYKILPKLHLIAGPSISWYYSKSNGETNHPLLPVFEYDAGRNNELIIGFKLSLRYSFREF